jgi:ElaB/YqjD/DUF883 family membrane-anchored ribosome-binding protein
MDKRAKKAIKTLENRVGATKAGMEKGGKDMRAGAEESMRKGRKAIRKHPLSAVGAAAGAAVAVGVVTGALLMQGSKAKKKKR